MVKKIVGYDNEGKKVFEREARQYDQTIADTPFKITINEIVRIIPVFVLLITVYVNQQNFNVQVLKSVNENSQAIGGMKDVLYNLNNYLSSTTGKQFKDGLPVTKGEA